MKTSAIVLVALLGYSASAASLKQKLSNNLVQGEYLDDCEVECEFDGDLEFPSLETPEVDLAWCDCYGDLQGGDGQFNQSEFAQAAGVS